MASWPLWVYFLAVIGVVASMLVASHFAGERHEARATGRQYESGIEATGDARVHVSVRYYAVALLFVLFDLEAVFLLSWAIAARPAGWTGLVEIAVFTGVLLAVLVYAWRDGALDWGPRA